MGLGQRVANVGHLHILAVGVVAADLEDQRALVRFDAALGHTTHHLRHGQRQAFGALGLGHEERVQHGHALREHRDLQLLLSSK